MASTGQGIGAGVGFLIGSYFGMGAFGAALGGMLGLWLDPPDAPDPPALGDLGVNSYVRNMPLAISYGQDKVYGGVITLFNNSVEMENEGSSKQPQFTPVYRADFSVAVSEGEIISFIRYYLNDKLLSELEDEDAIHLDFYPYLGSLTQEPNDDIVENDDNWAAFKGTAYVFCTGKIGKANSLPAFASEIKALLCETGEQEANPIKVLYDFLTNTRYGCGFDASLFDGSPTTSGSWKDEADYCDVVIDNVNGIGKTPFNVQHTSTTSRIYADLSNFPDDYWNGELGTIELDDVTYNFTVTDQTSTYIDVDPPVGGEAEDDDGDIFYLFKAQEPRFRYSITISNKIKGYDFVSDILQSCRGIIYFADGLLKINIAKNSETPLLYFGDMEEVGFVIDAECTTARIYADFSSYPIDYWNGDLGTFTDESALENFIVMDQTATYIDIVVPNDDLTFGVLSDIPSIGGTFNLVKDNIKKGTFTYSRRGTRERNNRTRIEFINRYDDYRQDIVEIEDVYDINETVEIREKTIRMEGIKRKSQAGRMCAFFADTSSCINFLCEFQTDIVGFFLTSGAIVGVSHTGPNWNAKLFRVISLEELEDFEVKVSCIEYVPSTLHDYSPPIDVTDDAKLPNPYGGVKDIERFFVVQDYFVVDRINILFKKPVDPYWVGANIYIQHGVGEDFVFFDKISKTTPSVKLGEGIDDAVVEFAYDPLTMYGAFTDTGSFWIEDEEIYYGEIDVVNYLFKTCTRGYNSTTPVAHTIDKYCSLRQTNNLMPYYDIPATDVGIDLTFKAISLNVYDIRSNSVTAPTATITPT